ncbi:MAG: 1-deoxy-D-xylulose-5-phosphate synthase [Candidatus Aureabacteria bacterium]|nr:1-deoxy-D-xylulose-5-phosphate synthase [Candidatus Auribacterota bacterium]
MSRYLDHIGSPADVRKLSLEDLPLLAAEVRERLVSVVSVTGGHLASSLGAVELTIALHYVFDCPNDPIVWDVGHQAYAHKILTGRNEAFSTLRQKGGVRGFPNRNESPYDAFGSGHASTAVSAATGLASARDISGGGGKVIAVIGDGSLTGGLCYEALNNAGHRARNLLVILNDNEMSISRNVGAISAYLNRIISSPVYNRVRSDMQTIVKSIPSIGVRILGTARRLEESLKNLIAPGIIFEELGFRYFGPIDGHDIPKLVELLSRLRGLEQPIILHVVTRKGKGYEHAERHPEYFHGTSPFDIATGKPRKEPGGDGYSEIFGRALAVMARRDPLIVAVTAAMAHGTGLAEFAAEFPGRFFDVGIAEGHAVTFAAGLAAGGMAPVVAIYATFLQRGYDQIVHDVCAQRLPVIFAVDRGGIVGADGATHTGQFALSYLRHIPNLVVMEPSSGGELEGMLRCARACKGPAALIYPKSGAEGGSLIEVPLGKSAAALDGSDLTILALGSMVPVAREAAERLAAKGRSAGVINARFVKPLDEEAILAAAARTGRLVTLEENALQGGFGSAVLELLASRGMDEPEVLCMGINDAYVEQGGRKDLLASLGLDADGVARRVLERFWPSPARRSGGTGGRKA